MLFSRMMSKGSLWHCPDAGTATSSWHGPGASPPIWEALRGAGGEGGCRSPAAEAGRAAVKSVTQRQTVSRARQREICAGLQGREADTDLCHHGPSSPHWVGDFLLECRGRKARQYLKPMSYQGAKSWKKDTCPAFKFV